MLLDLQNVSSVIVVILLYCKIKHKYTYIVTLIYVEEFLDLNFITFTLPLHCHWDRFMYTIDKQEQSLIKPINELIGSLRLLMFEMHC